MYEFVDFLLDLPFIKNHQWIVPLMFVIVVATAFAFCVKWFLKKEYVKFTVMLVAVATLVTYVYWNIRNLTHK